MALEILESEDVEVEHDQPDVERDGRGAEVAVNPRVGAQHLGVETCGGVDGTEAIAARGLADPGGGGVELGADLVQAPAEFARGRSAVAALVHAEVDVLPLSLSEAAQTAGVLGEQLAEDLAVPGAQQPGGHLDPAAPGERAKVHEQVGHPVDADIPRFLRGMSGSAEERRLAVVAESSERCTKRGGHRTTVGRAAEVSGARVGASRLVGATQAVVCSRSASATISAALGTPRASRCAFTSRGPGHVDE